MLLGWLRRWCRAHDPLVAIAVRWGGLTVAYTDRHQKIRYQTFPSDGLSAPLPSRASLVESAREVRSFIPAGARRCALTFASPHAFLSDVVSFDSGTMLVRQISSKAPEIHERELFFAIRSSMARRFWAFAERAQLDVDYLSQGAVTTFYALRAMRLFAHAKVIGVVAMHGSNICVDEFESHGWRSTHSFLMSSETSSLAMAESVSAFLRRGGDRGYVVEECGLLSREICHSLKNSGHNLLEVPLSSSERVCGSATIVGVPPGLLACLGLLTAHNECEEGGVV